jgi:hypothetical protein
MKKLTPGQSYSDLKKAEPLAKGKNGDWKSEGYTLTHETSGDSHHVEVRTKKGEQAAHFRAAPSKDNVFSMYSSHVYPEHRRKGLATAAYALIEKKSGKKLNPGVLSADSESLWSQTGRPFGQSFKKALECGALSKTGAMAIRPVKSEGLAKMSRPNIKLPNYPKVGTRNDQEVQPIESNRQKELYGRKVANAEFGDKELTRPTRLSGSSKIIRDRQGLTDAYGKRISGKFNRNTLGLNHDTLKGPKSAAITGAMRSKFEDGDDSYKAKLAVHNENLKTTITNHNQKVQAWRSKAYDLSNKVGEPGGREAYDSHISQRIEKPKLPRKPSKPKVNTQNLTPEQQVSRGRAVDSTINHEAFHHTMAEVERHYGKDEAKKVHQNLLSQFHPDTLSSVGGFIHDKLGYKIKSPKFTEEILAHSRDILVNPVKRERYKEFAGKGADAHIKNLKQGHQKAYEVAQQLKPGQSLSDLRKPK